ncbi:apolipoprotein Bb%2C tandem duplicate 1 [Scomber scombrus]|uniref:Apolipoprotein Bb, tandem duplicate 1 n=1 Tax=Scomber scombrus TaxID=13677 RepID=A0AAV1NRC2_SCOSC
MNDVEASLRNLNAVVAKMLTDISIYIQEFADMMKEIIARGGLPESLDFDIKPMVLYVIDTMMEMIQQIDLKGSSITYPA